MFFWHKVRIFTEILRRIKCFFHINYHKNHILLYSTQAQVSHSIPDNMTLFLEPYIWSWIIGSEQPQLLPLILLLYLSIWPFCFWLSIGWDCRLIFSKKKDLNTDIFQLYIKTWYSSWFSVFCLMWSVCYWTLNSSLQVISAFLLVSVVSVPVGVASLIASQKVCLSDNVI